MISFKYKRITINDKNYLMNYKIQDALEFEGKVFILFDSEEGPRNREFRNIECYDLFGKKLWTAEVPSKNPTDCYWGFNTIEPFFELVDSQYAIRASTFSSYDCYLDINTGKIIKKVFYK